jgi:hypothetical protein
MKEVMRACMGSLIESRSSTSSSMDNRSMEPRQSLIGEGAGDKPVNVGTEGAASCAAPCHSGTWRM